MTLHKNIGIHPLPWPWISSSFPACYGILILLVRGLLYIIENAHGEALFSAVEKQQR